MTASDIHLELRPFVKRMRTPPLHNPAVLAVVKLLLKIVPLPPAGPGVGIENIRLGPAGVRVYRPEGRLSGAGLLWMHGGGHIIGRAEDDRICAALARDLLLESYQFLSKTLGLDFSPSNYSYAPLTAQVDGAG